MLQSVGIMIYNILKDIIIVLELIYTYIALV